MSTTWSDTVIVTAVSITENVSYHRFCKHTCVQVITPVVLHWFCNPSCKIYKELVHVICIMIRDQGKYNGPG